MSEFGWLKELKTEHTGNGKGGDGGGAGFEWAEPDMEVLRLHRRPPPRLPLEVFGSAWVDWIEEAAEAAACPPDYVVAPLLSDRQRTMATGERRLGRAPAFVDRLCRGIR